MPRPLDLTHLRDDKIAFIEKLLRQPDGTPCQPFPAQVEVLNNIARTTVLVAGRQFGKSTVFGWDGAWYCTTHPNRLVWTIAPSVDQSRIIFDEIARHFRPGQLLSSLVEGKIVDYPFPRMRLKNGTLVQGRGANSPQFIRGKRAHRAYVDETAFIKDSVCSNIIEPMFTVTGNVPDAALILTGTPFGDTGYFADTYHLGEHGGEDGFRSFHYTSEDNPHADKRFLARQKARYGEDSLLWRTEYLGLFLGSDKAVFPWDDIKWAYENWPFWNGEQSLFPLASDARSRYVQGVDLGNRRDYTVSSVLDVTNPAAMPLVALKRLRQKDYATYKALVRDHYHSYNNARTLVDATSLGESVVEDLADIGAEGYAFGGSRAKAEVVFELQRLLSEHRLLLPNNRDILDELRYFEYDITPAKALRMEAAKGHDDIVMSLALAAHLATIPGGIGLFAGVDLGRTETKVVKRQERPTPGKDYYDPFAELFMDDAELADVLAD